MHHGSARSAIDLVLRGNAFGRCSVTAAMLAALSDEQVVSSDCIEAGWDALRVLPADHIEIDSLPETGQLPDNDTDLAAQLLPVVLDNPQHIGRQLTRLWALCELWPHASWDERKHLRTAWLRACCSSTAPEASYLTRQQLREWQRGMPTLAGADTCSSAELAALVETNDPQDAHYVISAYLGAGAELDTLGKVLSTLCSRLLLHRFDDQAQILDALCGCIAIIELHEHNHLAPLATAIGQLAHNVWWCAKDPNCKTLQPGSDNDCDLSQAIRNGDMTAASRKARTMALNGSPFWAPIGSLLHELIDGGNQTWLDAVACTLTMHRRHRGEDGVINPDQAATIAATYAALFHLAQRGSRPFQRS